MASDKNYTEKNLWDLLQEKSAPSYQSTATFMKPVDKTTRRSNFLVLLGAGASKPLGIPTMVDLVNEFHNHVQKNISDDAKRKLLDIIVNVCKEAGFVDIEAILRALNDLTVSANSVTNMTIAKYLGTAWPPPNYSGEIPKVAEGVSRKLKIFLRKRCSELEREKAITIYQSLFEPLFAMDNLIDVFTTNYDLAVETYAQEMNLLIEDGFRQGRYRETYWQPATLDLSPGQGQKMIRLHKLHGSINWYIDEKRRIRWSEALDVSQLPAWGKVENLLIYPLDEKSVLREPFLELFLRLRNSLCESHWVSIIAVGYSFRDDHITDLIRDALIRGGAFLTIIDPKAIELWHRHFKDSPAGGFVYALSESIEDEAAIKQLKEFIEPSK